MRRVEGEPPRLGVRRRHGRRQRAVRVEVVGRLDAPRRRPLPLVAPAAAVVELALRGLAAADRRPSRRSAPAPRPRAGRSRRRAASGRRTRAAPRSSAARPRRSSGPKSTSWQKVASPRMPTWLHGPMTSRCGAAFFAAIAAKYSVSACGKRVVPAGRDRRGDVGVLRARSACSRARSGSSTRRRRRACSSRSSVSSSVGTCRSAVWPALPRRRARRAAAGCAGRPRPPPAWPGRRARPARPAAWM